MLLSLLSVDVVFLVVLVVAFGVHADAAVVVAAVNLVVVIVVVIAVVCC